jgi:restriction endonuclease Mrr
MRPVPQELEDASYTWQDMDQAYQDGREDLADQMLELIQQSDYEITLEEMVRFLEAEKGYHEDTPHPASLKDPSEWVFLWADPPEEDATCMTN